MNGVPPKLEFKEYPRWLRNKIGAKTTAEIRSHYEIAVKQLKEQTIQSPFWQTVAVRIHELDASFHTRHSVFLLPVKPLPDVVEKSFRSMLNKSYRKNYLQNADWPNDPPDGWVTPNNWFSRINDPIRTTVVVTYLDGVLFLSSQLEEIARNLSVACHTDYEAKPEGYYAAHFYTTLSGEVRDVGLSPQTVTYSFEVQVVTQFQQAIRPITHDFYEQRRDKLQPSGNKWQWEYASDEFRANYLAHTLHHLEGLIVDLRRRVME